MLPQEIGKCLKQRVASFFILSQSQCTSYVQPLQDFERNSVEKFKKSSDHRSAVQWYRKKKGNALSLEHKKDNT